MPSSLKRLEKWNPQEQYLGIETDPKTGNPIITPIDKPSWLGRVWDRVLSFFGHHSLQKVARVVAFLLETKHIKIQTEAQTKALINLKARIDKFNSSRWHPGVDARVAECIEKAIPSDGLTDEERAQIAKLGAVNLPLAGSVKTTFAAMYPDLEKSVATGLIDSAFTACSIKGDGHCMFRAIAVALLEKYAHTPEFLSALVTNLATKQGFHKFPDKCIKSLRESIDALSKRESIEKIMCDTETSTSWVAFLKILAANYVHSLDEEAQNNHLPHMAQDLNNEEWMRVVGEHQGKLYQMRRDLEDPEKAETVIAGFEKVEADFKQYRKDILTAYLASKIDMSNKNSLQTYGTNLELIALSNVLKVTIGTINFDTTDLTKKLQSTTFPKNQGFETKIPEDISLFLVFRGSHYDTLFKK